MRNDVPVPPPETQVVRPSAALVALRVGTRERHRTLDTHLPVAQPDATHADYVLHLEALYGWLKPLNDPLWSLPWPEAVRASRRRGKATLIVNDLRRAEAMAFGRPGEPPLCPSVPRCHVLDAYAIGVAYVIEGSQLGGAVLARHFIGGGGGGDSKSDGGGGDARAFSYLVGYGKETGALWRTFIAFVDDAVRSEQDIAHMLRGACDAFDTITAWMITQHLLNEASRPADRDR
jgi:heme oxygenase (biliverdin-IX-beta and delta-forming)